MDFDALDKIVKTNNNSSSIINNNNKTKIPN